MRVAMILPLVFLLSACTSTPSNSTANSLGERHPAGVAGELMDPSDPRLIDHGPDALTVWSAMELARTPEGEAKLDKMFANAVSLTRLPEGYAAGAGAPLPDAPEMMRPVLAMITGDNWRGKIFCQGNGMESHGLNRIRHIPLISTTENSVLPMAFFKSYLVDPEDKRNLATDATSRIVILNYAHPVTTGQHPGMSYFTELLLKIPDIGQVYDVMAAVPGKYGPIYLGKTWRGYYDGSDVFHPASPQLIARFYLDFNPGALIEQKKSHWPPGNKEMPVSPGNNCNGVTLPR